MFLLSFFLGTRPWFRDVVLCFFFSSFPSFHTVFQVGLFLNLMVYVPVSQFFLLLLFSSPIFIGLANQRELGEFFQFYFFYLFLGTRLRFRDVVRCFFFVSSSGPFIGLFIWLFLTLYSLFWSHGGLVVKMYTPFNQFLAILEINFCNLFIF